MKAVGGQRGGISGMGWDGMATFEFVVAGWLLLLLVLTALT
jgi:hypothetical protein